MVVADVAAPTAHSAATAAHNEDLHGYASRQVDAVLSSGDPRCRKRGGLSVAVYPFVGMPRLS